MLSTEFIEQYTESLSFLKEYVRTQQKSLSPKMANIILTSFSANVAYELLKGALQQRKKQLDQIAILCNSAYVLEAVILDFIYYEKNEAAILTYLIFKISAAPSSLLPVRRELIKSLQADKSEQGLYVLKQTSALF